MTTRDRGKTRHVADAGSRVPRAPAGLDRLRLVARARIRPDSGVRGFMLAVRFTSAVVFVIFGVGKFANHASELASFEAYALPAPDIFVYGVGVVEIAGGVLLVFGPFVRLAALVLAGDMVGAIVVSGIARGETVSLTVAPLLLVAMVLLMLDRRGPQARIALGPRLWRGGPDRRGGLSRERGRPQQPGWTRSEKDYAETTPMTTRSHPNLELPRRCRARNAEPE